MSTTKFPIDAVRRCFPSLAVRSGRSRRVYFDNPAGTQVARQAMERMRHYLTRSVANVGGEFRTSVETGRLVEEAREACAQFVNARSPEEIVFGANMTTLTFHMIHALAPLVGVGDEIVVTRMDHDANVSPWRLLARRCGATLKFLDFNRETYRYELAELDSLLTRRTKIVAVNHASNITGTINDVEGVSRRAKAAGALVYVDSVQYAPHGVVDVQQIGCDFLVCSAYKFFGPHLGVLWGRRELLESLVPLKLRPSPNEVPFRFETGTLPFEQLAALLGTLEYYAWLGDQVAPPAGQSRGKRSASLGERINRGKVAMQRHEESLALELIAGLSEHRELRIHGITAPSEVSSRVSTVSFTHARHAPADLARRLAERDIFVWSGDNYAIELIEHLGLQDSGGVLRVGPVHYNTVGEVRRFLAALEDIVAPAVTRAARPKASAKPRRKRGR
jgi:cysteine desulfurase family protein (TIGR01976 family)